MEKASEEKVLEMLQSRDPDMQKLGLVTLQHIIDNWKDYRDFKGRSILGVPILPKHVRKEVRRRIISMEARKTEWLKYHGPSIEG